MADPLLGTDTLSAEWLPAAAFYVGRGWVAGPAGTAALSLAAGVEVDIDVAWPTRLAGLRIESRADGSLGERAAAVLARLLEPAVARQLLDLATVDHDGPVLLSRRGTSDLRRGTGVAPALFRPALARMIADDRTQPPFRRALALLESGRWLGRAGRDLGLTRTARGDLRSGSEILLTSLDDQPLRIDPRAAEQLADLVARAAEEHVDRSPTRRRLVVLAADLRAGRHSTVDRRADQDRQVASGSADAFASPAAAMPRRLMHAASAPQPQAVINVDRRAAPPALARAPIRAVRRSRAEVEIVLPRAGSLALGCWGRVFDESGTLVALAPFRVDGDNATALLLVAPDSLPTCTVDVTAEPHLARPSPELTATETAIRHGRAAASAERVDRRAAASREWARSAAEWSRAGDADRQAVALQYADGGGGRGSARSQRIPPPLVADYIDAGEPDA